jgi:hypothetical protein
VVRHGHVRSVVTRHQKRGRSCEPLHIRFAFFARCWRCDDPYDQGGRGPIMPSLTWNIERGIEMPRLPVTAMLLAGLAALNIASVVLALLAA